MSEFQQRLNQIRKKLLDLSKRNQLIKYRRPPKSRNIKIIDESPEFIYEYLVHKGKVFNFKAIPYPKMMPKYMALVKEKETIESKLPALEIEVKLLVSQFNWRPKRTSATTPASYSIVNQIIKIETAKRELTKRLEELVEEIEVFDNDENFTVESQAKEMGLVLSSEMPEIELHDENNFDIHLDSDLQTLHFPYDLEQILKNIEFRSRSIMEMAGSNMLYLILGVLEWREPSKPDDVIKSPLITVPVSLKRLGFDATLKTYKYSLDYTGDIIETNESLSQKLFSDFKIKLPKLTEELSFNNYIKEVQKICSQQKNWKIKQEISLDFLQFGKVLMYKDLNHQGLKSHPILRDVFLGKASNNSAYAVDEYEIDKEPMAQKAPLVLDADSSQHSAIVDVLKGKNVVIEGPPGSGKSQIIANLIAVLMAEGKKVLFVSEKLVALEVVYQRLEQIGLGDFCLELHSHKTDKVEFLANLKKRIEGDYKLPKTLLGNKKSLEQSKVSLNEYLERLHQPYGNCGKNLFDTVWLREKYAEGESYFRFKITNASNLKEYDLRVCEELLKEYATHYSDYNIEEFYWHGLEVTNLSFSEIDRFVLLLQELKIAYQELGENTTHSVEEISRLKSFSEEFLFEDEYFFAYEEFENFYNLEKRLERYLGTFVNYLGSSEVKNLSTADILESVQNSFELLRELFSFESEFNPELMAFQRFIKNAQENFERFEEIERNNSENLALEMVNHKSTEDIFHIVSTIIDKKDSWFRFLSPSYKRAVKDFQLTLKEMLPQNRDEWTLLLRELNVYTLNRENQLNLRLMLIQKVPLFVEKIVTMERKIKSTLEVFQTIQKSELAMEFKELLYRDAKNFHEFEPLIKGQERIENIIQKINNFGVIESSVFYGKDELKFDDITDKLDEVERHKSTLSEWITLQNLLTKLKDLGLKEMMKSAERGEIPKDKLVDVFYFNYYNSLLQEAFLLYPELKNFNRVKHELMVEKFRKLDVEVIKQNSKMVAYELSQKELPYANGAGRVGTFTNLKLLKHEIGKKRRHVPIRQLLKRAGGAISVLKPCYMMSPLSVAQYLPIESSKFDVLLIDEASQLKPEESLGVIARAKQVVVVGDPKQLPPTSFFDTLQDEVAQEQKTVLDDSESILDSFMELYSPIRRLKWHYRSAHESLISFSNRHFYDGELTIFPSASNQDEHLGVKYTYVENGFYKSGQEHRVNVNEANEVLKQIEYQMKNFPEKSLGVGTLNGTQRELIQELVDSSEKNNLFVATYIERWRAKHEPFFVKNLESLQGDERDVILISTTYGKEEGSSHLNQRFGPINQESGWRRLNVLITRSKQKMHVFTSMLSSDIVIKDSSSRGVKALKSFLKFLEVGCIKEEQLEKEKDSSAFVEVLYETLKKRGIDVVKNIGVSGYYIDLAVVSKRDGRYILAIECDGEKFYEAKSSSDRYRLKFEALKRLSWRHYFVWSAEWYKNRELELERLVEYIEEIER